MFRNLLLSLRDGESTKEDWKQSHVANIDFFQDSTRLFYSNKEVAKFNYDRLLDLNMMAYLHDLSEIKTITSIPIPTST